MKLRAWALGLCLVSAGAARAANPAADAAIATVTALAHCGAVVSLATHGNSTTRYSWLPGQKLADLATGVALVLLVGGPGTLDLDDKGCPRHLNANILVRSAPLWRAAGLATVLVDAPSDWSGEDGLAGFRIDAAHAQDLARVMQDVRKRTGAQRVWLIGHSRGSLSAANAAARLRDADAPDGVVLASPMLSGEGARRKPWATQTVQATGIQDFTGALLVLGHAADNCTRSLPSLLDAATQGAKAARVQVARLTGGPRSVGRAASLNACEVHEAHDFVDQDAEFAAGVLRFVLGQRF